MRVVSWVFCALAEKTHHSVVLPTQRRELDGRRKKKNQPVQYQQGKSKRSWGEDGIGRCTERRQSSTFSAQLSIYIIDSNVHDVGRKSCAAADSSAIKPNAKATVQFTPPGPRHHHLCPSLPIQKSILFKPVETSKYAVMALGLCIYSPWHNFL